VPVSVSYWQQVVHFRWRNQFRLSECTLIKMQSTGELKKSQYLAENLLRCLHEPIFRCNGEDGHFIPQTYSPFVVFTLCAVRLTPNFLYLRNVLSDSLPPFLLFTLWASKLTSHSFYLQYALSYSPQLLTCTLCAARLTPNNFYLHYALYNSPQFYICVVVCS
jgi:hypothetical protein